MGGTKRWSFTSSAGNPAVSADVTPIVGIQRPHTVRQLPSIAPTHYIERTSPNPAKMKIEKKYNTQVLPYDKHLNNYEHADPATLATADIYVLRKPTAYSLTNYTMQKHIP